MKILVINAGSSSLKCQLFDMKSEKVLAKLTCEKIGLKGSSITLKHDGKQKVYEVKLENHEQSISNVIKILLDKENNIISSLDEIDAVGHRVLHGGEIYTSSVVIDKKVMKNLEELKPLGPLHMPANIMGIKACQEVMKKKPQVAVFDTEFHATLPDYAYRYAIPKKAYTDWKIRKYGFHGTSHKFVANELAKLTGKKGKFIICHIGNGASISAVKNGVCLETSMGFTPLEGLVMGTRSGDIDPAVVQRIMEMSGKNIEQTMNYLNKESGLLGVSGVSSDIRDIQAVAEKNKDAQLAVKMLCYRVKKYIGEYIAVLNGVDAIAFTAGSGENRPELRQEIMDNLDWLGISVDKKKNYGFERGVNYEITGKNSRARVFVVPTDEELMIARDTKKLVIKK